MASLIAGIGAVHHAGARRACGCRSTTYATVSRALDCGAEAIIAPMINTPADARAFAAAAKYPPLGERSWGPLRAMPLQGRTVATDYLREANDGTLTLAMIETRTALSNVDAIAATPGIDALFIGPYDLSTALSGGTAQDIDAPEVDEAIERDRRCRAQGRQDPRHLLPRRGAGAGHGETWFPFSDRRQRPRPGARRRRRAGQGAEALGRPISASRERRSYRWY